MFENYIKIFVNNMILTNKSKRTATEYEYDLNLFDRFITCNYKNVGCLEDVTESMVEDYQVYLRTEKTNNKGLPLSPVTINRKYYSLRSFFKFLIKKRILLKENPTSSIEPINTTTLSTHVYLSQDQAQLLLNNINTRYAERDRLMIEFMLVLGIRVSEVSNINISDINSNTKTITIHGKGNKERTLPLPDNLLHSIEIYKDYRRQHYKNVKTNALFISRNHKRITIRQIQNIVNSLVNELGYNQYLENEPSRKKITPHKLRHTFGTLSAQRGVDILVLKDILGHSSINTTTIYAKASNQQITDAIVNNPIYRK